MVQAAQIVMAGDASVAKSGNRCVVNQLFSVVFHVFSFALSFIRFSSFLFFPLPFFLSFSSLSFVPVHLFSFLSFPFPYWVHFSHSFSIPSLFYFSLSFLLPTISFFIFFLILPFSCLLSFSFSSSLISLPVTVCFQLPFLPLSFPSAFIPILLFLFFFSTLFTSFPPLLFQSFHFPSFLLTPLSPLHFLFSLSITSLFLPLFHLSFLPFLLLPSFQSPLGSNKDKDLKERKKK